MENKIKELINPELLSLNLYIDSVILEKENGNTFLRICLDSENIIDLDKVVLATNIINPILDDNNFIDERYFLDVYAKSKGSESNECK